jgi:hypothetical protein
VNTILVAFRVAPVPDTTVDLSAFPPPANYKNEDAIARWRAEFAAKAAVAMAQQPFTGTLDEVHFSDLAHKRVAGFKNDNAKVPLCLRVRSWLLAKHTWSPEYRPEKPPTTRFVGFNPKAFLKILGHECAMPQHNVDGKPAALPLSMWQGNQHNVDIEPLFISDDCKYLSWREVLLRHGLLEKFANWAGPGVDPSIDLTLATLLAGRIGLFNETVT